MNSDCDEHGEPCDDKIPKLEVGILLFFVMISLCILK